MSQTSAYPPGTYESDKNAPWNAKENPHPVIEDALSTVSALQEQLEQLRDIIGSNEFSAATHVCFNCPGPLSYLDELYGKLKELQLAVEDGEYK